MARPSALVSGLFAAALAVGLTGCWRPATAPSAAVVPGDPVPVRAVAAEIREVTRALRINATIEAARRADLTPEVSGIVLRVLKREGDVVAAGEPLLELDDHDFRLAVDQARAQLARAEAAIAQAEANLVNVRAQHRRAEELRARRILSQNDFENSESNLRVAKATLQAARADRELAAAGLARAEKSLGDTVLRAPFSGHVVRRLVDEGALIRTTPPVIALVIAEIDPVEIAGAVGEYDTADVSAGMPAEISIDALGGRRFAAAVDAINPVLDADSRSARIRIVTPNPRAELKPGMAATIILPLGSLRGVAVPRQAVSEEQASGSFLFVIGATNEVERRAVTVAERTDQWALIGAGLQQGERVVTAGQEKLHGGEQVSVVGG